MYLVIFYFRDTNKDILCCKYTEDDNHIAAGFSDGTIRVFCCNTGDNKHTLVDDETRAYPGPVTAIKHRPVSKANPITNMLLSSCEYYKFFNYLIYQFFIFPVVILYTCN